MGITELMQANSDKKFLLAIRQVDNVEDLLKAILYFKEHYSFNDSYYRDLEEALWNQTYRVMEKKY